MISIPGASLSAVLTVSLLAAVGVCGMAVRLIRRTLNLLPNQHTKEMR